jgi:hypothetical protein
MHAPSSRAIISTSSMFWLFDRILPAARMVFPRWSLIIEPMSVTPLFQRQKKTLCMLVLSQLSGGGSQQPGEKIFVWSRALSSVSRSMFWTYIFPLGSARILVALLQWAVASLRIRIQREKELYWMINCCVSFGMHTMSFLDANISTTWGEFLCVGPFQYYIQKEQEPITSGFRESFSSTCFRTSTYWYGRLYLVSQCHKCCRSLM